MTKTAELQAIASQMNERQQAYLRTAYVEDQRREQANRGPGSPPARQWRWIEYGPVGARWLDSGRLLRSELERAGLVSSGTGATWAALEGRGLLTLQYRRTGLVETRSRRHNISLFVRLTTDGRKVARLLLGEPVTKSGSKGPAPLSVSALRLIYFGQTNPDLTFSVHDPWGTCPLPYLAALGVTRGLVKRGLLSGDAPGSMKITAAGLALDVAAEANWRPLRPHPYGSAD